ncbi:putative Fe-Mo cluster-binding NifX family protein [Methanohalophilus levihalophilus]|uniref:NifB/NifX family molybdenum-iron cluster-binding protein n=1 Tax=Methanohalophilus levihalophilus TaxID=1431282 RepID=UPI001AE6FF67|nr:NifB/NifX family molybdenum-iron cluster-binding protein [Methanohalophilus levihalophilus]MBP2030151.1 putative Fe-Mo cluster-binding NifX family protein [Methanohalophilus levihalophilus]
MNICIPSSGEELTSNVDLRFGRCNYFVIVDSENMNARAFRNPAISATGGAGIQAAQEIVRQNANVLLTGNIGPNAHQVLSTAGINVFELEGNTVEEAVKMYNAGELQVLSEPNSAAHAGMGRGMGQGRQNRGNDMQGRQ